MTIQNTKRIDAIKRYGKTARGKLDLIRHLEGGKLTLRQAVYAHCYDCMGFFADGKVDCKIPACSLYPFMAYNKTRIRRTTARVITEDHKAKLKRARLRLDNTHSLLRAISNNDD